MLRWIDAAARGEATSTGPTQRRSDSATAYWLPARPRSTPRRARTTTGRTHRTANCELTQLVLCGVGSHFQRREAGGARGSPHAQPTEPLRRGRPAIVALVAANEQIGQAAKS